MTPILLFYYLLSIAGGVLVIGFAGLLVLAVFFVMVGDSGSRFGSNRKSAEASPEAESASSTTTDGQVLVPSPAVAVVA